MTGGTEGGNTCTCAATMRTLFTPIQIQRQCAHYTLQCISHLRHRHELPCPLSHLDQVRESEKGVSEVFPLWTGGGATRSTVLPKFTKYKRVTEVSHAGGSETTSDAARNTVTRTGSSIAKRFHTFSFQESGDVCACVFLCQCVARQSHARTLAYDGEGDASVTLNETPQIPISVFVSVRRAMEPCTHLHVRRCLSSPASQCVARWSRAPAQT